MNYLTSADYNDGLANENPSWSYDAAGNRNDVTVVDNLNRATTIAGANRTYDILGNTLTIGSTKSMNWDVLNRMISHTASSVTTNYAYRADGMRVTKDNGTTLSKFYYDGQMPIETAEVGSSSTVVTRNGLGARGIDRIERVGTSTTVGYPIYDAHGNMVATLGKSGSSYSLGDQRSYDAWGGIRSGNTTGDPKGRYCANLGHLDDDESGLTYMRARYYESGSGRFISEDPAADGINWSVYCKNNPVNHCDPTGQILFALITNVFCAIMFAAINMWQPDTPQGKCVQKLLNMVDAMIDCTANILALASSDVRGANVAIAASFILAGVGAIAMVIAIVHVQMLFLISEGYGDAEMDSCPDALTPNEAAGNNFGGSPHW